MRDDYKWTVYSVIDCAMEVYNELGFGLAESIYQEAMSIELNSRGIENECEVNVDIYYKGMKMVKKCRLDMLVNDVIVELKAVVELSSEHRMQLFNYMRLTKKEVGLLINFGERMLHAERYCYDKKTNMCYRVDKNMMPVT